MRTSVSSATTPTGVKRPRAPKVVDEELQASQSRTRKLKALSKPTAWKNWKELDAVGESLCSFASMSAVNNMRDSRMNLHEALERVAVWRNRQNPLPHSVDSTAALAQLISRDASDSSDSFLLRLMYSSTIVRTVNGLVDSMQQSRAAATSVSLLAQQLGIPTWLVDVRHEATHNQLPPLPVLRMASHTLLHYLEAVYWGPLREKHTGNERAAFNLLEAYRLKATPPSNISETSKSKIVHGSDEDDDEDEDDEHFSPDSIRLGTVCNSFAVLQDPAKKKKKRQVVSKKKRKAKKGPSNAAMKQIARDFVESGLPTNVIFETALLFLVEDSAILLYPPSDHFSMDITGIQRVQKYYGPLISEIMSSWPNFLGRLVSSLFNSILAIELNSDQSQNVIEMNRALFFGKSWIEFLFSPKFIVGVGLDSTILSNEENGSVPLEVLETKFNYLPLMNLCQRWYEEVPLYKNETAGTSRSIVDLFESITRKGGDIQRSTVRQEESSGVATVTTVPIKPEPPKRNLDDLEAMLAEPSPTVATEGTSGETTIPVSQAEGWTKCELWEPCPLGMLPCK